MSACPEECWSPSRRGSGGPEVPVHRLPTNRICRTEARRQRRSALALAWAAALGGWLLADLNQTALATQTNLVISTNASDPAPRSAWAALITRFQRENPDLNVSVNVYDHESYKKQLRNWLTSVPPDVVFWFVGNRMRQLVEPGLLADVSEIFSPEVRADLMPSALELVSYDGRQYGAPYGYYPIGLYFRRDLLDKAGAPLPPKTWEDLITTCERLKRIGIEPIALGSRDLWPLAGWFDYINLRLNGRDFHLALTAGRVPFDDPRVLTVFAKWRELLDRGCFVSTHASASWQESQALLYRGAAGMVLIGGFIVANFPPAVRDQIGFVRFPSIDPTAGDYEEAPMNSLHVPSRARNPKAGMRFLSFVLRADVQEALSAALNYIPVNSKAALTDDPFLNTGRELVTAADGLTQYLDRDAREEMANVVMKGLQEFVLHPDRLDAIIEEIERTRRRIHR